MKNEINTDKSLTIITDVEDIYNDISMLIEEKHNCVKTAVNNAMVSLYWSIGKYLVTKVLKNQKPDYGDRVIEGISQKLTMEYGSGYNETSINRMIKFYQLFTDYEKVATLSQLLSWSHFVVLLPIKDELAREFYATMCMLENWSVRTLRERKKSMLYERTAISKKPENTIRQELQKLQSTRKLSADMVLHDPYVLDFLGLRDTFSEKDLENAILAEIEKFLLELGAGFAFLERQKHIVFEGKDYYMDLLFYHRTMRRLVLVELKLGEFEPEHKGQVEFYLRWLNKYERAEGEETPIALILCSEKNQETIELLGLDKGDIHVAQYITKMPPKEILEKKLTQAINIAREKLETMS